MSLPYLFVFAQAHDEFRIPEILSVAELHGFQVQVPDEYKSTRPFMVISLESEEQATILAQRCILIKSIHEFYARGSTYEELHAQNLSSQSRWSRYAADTSFRFSVSAYNHRIPESRQREIMESFSYMNFLGKIDMRTPEITLGCFEEYERLEGGTRTKLEGDGQFQQVYFGRLIVEGSARSLIAKFDVKKRVYFGNTSMEAEVSLLMANQTLASPGKLVYDPFIGTGSMAYTTAHFGALVFGSDIDGRQMRGKEKPPGIIRAASQYGLSSRIVDLCTFDVTRHPWRCGSLFDAIVTDPPYGVRAGAKRLGRRREANPRQEAAYKEHQKAPRPDDQPYIPPTKPYELSNLVSDLVLLARYLLKPGGRLVFFLPTVTDEYEDIDIRSMLCEGMCVIANSLQDFGSWGRRLVTIRKTSNAVFPAPSFEGGEVDHVPAHKHFREKFFQGFRKDDEAQGSRKIN